MFVARSSKSYNVPAPSPDTLSIVPGSNGSPTGAGLLAEHVSTSESGGHCGGEIGPVLSATENELNVPARSRLSARSQLIRISLDCASLEFGFTETSRK